MTYSDRQLKSFLDQKLDAEKTAEIEQAMRVDRELELRVMSLDAPALELREVMLSLPNEAVLKKMETRVFHGPKRTSRITYLMQTAAVLVVGLGLDAGGMSFFATPPKPDWRHEVAQYQSLYVAETVTSHVFDTATLVQQLERASAKINRNLDSTMLLKLGELDLARAQILNIDGQPLIQIAYRGPNNAPFALCIMPNTGPNAQRDITSEDIHDLATASWKDDDFQYTLVGGTDATFVNYHARMAQGRLNETLAQLSRSTNL